MSATEFGPNHPLAVRLWAKRLAVETLRETFLDRFMGSDKNSIIYVRQELKKAAGDRITVGLRVQMNGTGVQGDNTLEGNEEAFQTFDDTMIIDQLRHATRSKGKMSEKRVPFNVRQEGMEGLRDWWADRIDQSGFNQLCGFTPQADVRYTGLQPVLAPDAAHIFRPNGETTDEALNAGDEFNIVQIDTVLARIKAWQTTVNTQVPIRPIKYKGGTYYVLFIHPYQALQLRTNYNAGAWADLQKTRISGTGTEDNYIFQGGSFLGVYNGVAIHESARVTEGVHSVTGAAVANVRRAVMCGAQAACFASGREEGQGERMTWVEETFDYKNQLGIAAGMIFGMKKSRFNSRDFATMVMSSYSPAP